MPKTIRFRRLALLAFARCAQIIASIPVSPSSCHFFDSLAMITRDELSEQTADEPPDASSSECPRHHQRELFSPECATVRPRTLIHDDICICIAQRVRPPPCVLQEERLLCASDKVCARKRTRHDAWRLVTAARRGAQDRTVDLWMPKPKSEGQLSNRRDAEHRGTLSGQRHAKPRLRPSANVLDEELLVRREPLRLKAW